MSKRIIIDELEFEVPYGKLAAKTYHEETDDCKRVLALHGWLDNSGTFDHVMPHVKYEKGLYIVCLELPGHGRSSQLPPGAMYNDINMVAEVRRCIKELNWHQTSDDTTANRDDQKKPQKVNTKKFSIIAHSWGAGLALLYASIYPNDVEEVVSIDFLKSRTKKPEQVLDDTAASIDQFLEIVPSISPFSSPHVNKAKSSNPTIRGPDKGSTIVSHETAIIATIEGHVPMGTISRDDAICLLKRSTVAVSTPPNSVIYTRDLRLQSMIVIRDHIEINKVMFARANCHILFILCKTGLLAGEDFMDNYETMVNHYKSRAKSAHVQWMNADHFIHMTHAKRTAEMINEFLASPVDYKVFNDFEGTNDHPVGINLS